MLAGGKRSVATGYPNWLAAPQRGARTTCLSLRPFRARLHIFFGSDGFAALPPQLLSGRASGASVSNIAHIELLATQLLVRPNATTQGLPPSDNRTASGPLPGNVDPPTKPHATPPPSDVCLSLAPRQTLARPPNAAESPRHTHASERRFPNQAVLSHP